MASRRKDSDPVVPEPLDVDAVERRLRLIGKGGGKSGHLEFGVRYRYECPEGHLHEYDYCERHKTRTQRLRPALQ